MEDAKLRKQQACLTISREESTPVTGIKSIVFREMTLALFMLCGVEWASDLRSQNIAILPRLKELEHMYTRHPSALIWQGFAEIWLE